MHPGEREHRVFGVRRACHIVLACLLALQPAVPLWAAAPDCEMAAMHSTDDGGHARQPCDCCDEADCAAPCQALFASPIALPQPFDLRHPLTAGGFTSTDSDQIPAGHARPAFRPPITR